MSAPDPRTHAIPQDVVELLPESLVREYCVLPARADEQTITLFCPNDRRFDSEICERLQFMLNRRIEWWPAQPEMILEAITQYFGELPILVRNCNCAVNFRLRCPQRWEELRPTDNEQVRFCDVCASSVHRAADQNEADLLARLGKCVAYASLEGVDSLGLIEFD